MDRIFQIGGIHLFYIVKFETISSETFNELEYFFNKNLTVSVNITI